MIASVAFGQWQLGAGQWSAPLIGSSYFHNRERPVADVILNALEMKAVEKAAFSDGIDAESLMDRAGEGIANAILEQEPCPGIAVAYLGKGNNAGDAMVASSLLAKAGWEIWTRPLVPESELQGLPRKKWQNLDEHRVSGPAHRSAEEQIQSHPRRFAWTRFQVGTQRPPESSDARNQCACA